MKIAVASGKGGTGKTLVSTNLAMFLSVEGGQVIYVDADVETPNGHLFLHPTEMTTWPVTTTVPRLKQSTCSGCGACQEHCMFNAILSAKGKVIVFNELCHGCGACLLACKENALVETPRLVGHIEQGLVREMLFFAGRLEVGEARATPLIEAVVSKAFGYTESLVVLDAPPGVSCGAVAAVKQSDLVLLVTEPTPFGLHDLALACDMCRALQVPTAAIINRSDLGSREVRDYLEDENIPILAEIPFDRQIAETYAAGALASVHVPVLKGAMKDVAAYIDTIRKS